MSRCSERASSIGFKSSRWMFSISATATADSSGMSRTTAGIVVQACHLRRAPRRSPATISYRVSPPVTFGSGRTTIGCTTPCALIDSASSASESSRMSTRGWYLPRRKQLDGHLAQAAIGRLGRGRGWRGWLAVAGPPAARC